MSHGWAVPGPGARILLVEDELTWARILAEALAAGGHGVRSVRSAAAARAAVAADPPDLVVLDLTLPDEDGLVLCADLKAAVSVPVLICSQTQRRSDVVLGLRLGADDFVSKPCDLEELIERVGVLLRTRAPAPPDRVADAGRLVLDRVQRRARLGGVAVSLTSGEYQLLAALAERPGQTIPRRELAATVFGQPESRRALDTLIWRVWAKLAVLGPHTPRVATARGVGYRLVGAGG
ncbi:MAG TPA: response regulator transcription factor [Chloroflexota bacterium]